MPRRHAGTQARRLGLAGTGSVSGSRGIRRTACIGLRPGGNRRTGRAATAVTFPVTGVPPIPDPYWFDAIAEHLGKSYWAPDTGRVQAFTAGTEQEVDFLVDALALEPGMRVLDVGCGPGRHTLTLARRGHRRAGRRSQSRVRRAGAGGGRRRWSPRRVRRARRPRPSLRSRVRRHDLPVPGRVRSPGWARRSAVFGRIARTLRVGRARSRSSAFSATFAVRHLDAGEDVRPRDRCPARTGDRARSGGLERPFDLWTTCFTARELGLLATSNGLVVDAVHGVSPGAYRAQPPNLDHHELLLVAHRP